MSSRSSHHRHPAFRLPWLSVVLLLPGPAVATEVEETAWFSLSPPLSDSSVRVLIHTTSADIQGWSLGLCHDPDAIGVKAFDWSRELATVRGGAPPEFHLLELAADPPRAGIVQSVILSATQPVYLPQRRAGFPVLDVEYDVRGESTVQVCGGLRGSREPVPVSLTLDPESYTPSRTAAATLVPALFSLSPPVSDGHVTVSIHTRLNKIQGWSLSICNDPQAAQVVQVKMSDRLERLRGGNPPFFSLTEEAADGSRAGVLQAVILDAFTPLTLPPRAEGFPILEIDYLVVEETPISICDGLQGSGSPVPTIITIDSRSYRPRQPFSATLVKKAYRDKLAYRTEPPETGEVLTVKLFTDNLAVQGWAFALCNTSLAADVVEVRTAPELELLMAGEPPEYVFNDIAFADPFIAVTQKVYLGSSHQPLAMGPFPGGLPLLGIRYRVYAEDPVKFCDQVGGVRFDNRVTIDGIGTIPGTREGSLLAPGALGERFVRGDADANGLVEITDPAFILGHLFLGSDWPPCLDAADANDVGGVDISDPIFLLHFLFLKGPPPPSPFPEPGTDLSPGNSLGCERGL